jgi:hypothetical protein
MLQARRSKVPFPMRSLDFLNLPDPFIRIMTLGLTQPLTEMSTREMFVGSEVRPARRA